MYSLSLCQILNGGLLAQKHIWSETVTVQPALMFSELAGPCLYLHCAYTVYSMLSGFFFNALHKMSPSLMLTGPSV